MQVVWCTHRGDDSGYNRPTHWFICSKFDQRVIVQIATPRADQPTMPIR
jgi:hypothetical protein